MKLLTTVSLFCLLAAKCVISKPLEDSLEDEDENEGKSAENIHEINTKARNGEEFTEDINFPPELRSDGPDNLQIGPEEENTLKNALTEVDEKLSDEKHNSEKDDEKQYRKDANDEMSTSDEKDADELNELEDILLKSGKSAEHSGKHESLQPFEFSESKEGNSNENTRRHRKDTVVQKNADKSVFSLETIEIEPSGRAGDSDSDENNSQMPTSRHGLGGIIRGTKRMLTNGILQRKMEMDDINAGLQNGFPQQPDVLGVQPFQPEYNQMRDTHPENHGMFYHDPFQLLRSSPRSGEPPAIQRRYEPGFNTYPYTEPATTLQSTYGPRLFGDHRNGVTHPQYNLPGFFNIFDPHFSPLKHPVFGNRFAPQVFQT